MADTELAPDQGINSVADEAQPSAPEKSANAGIEDRLGKALLASMGNFDDEPDEGSEVEEPAEAEPEALVEEDEEEAPEEDAPTESPEAQLERWVSQVAENPKSINQIPAKRHPEVMQAVLAAERDVQQRAVQIAYEQGMAAAEQQAKVREAVARIDTMRKEDPEGFADWVDENPDQAEAYMSLKRNKPAAGAPVADTREALANQARRLWAKLDAYPDVKAATVTKAQGVPLNEDGIAQLAEMVADALAEAKTNERIKNTEPARKAAEQRQQAAAERKQIPRPEGTGGQKAESVLTDDVNELLAMGLRQEMRNSRKAVAAGSPFR